MLLYTGLNAQKLLYTGLDAQKQKWIGMEISEHRFAVLIMFEVIGAQIMFGCRYAQMAADRCSQAGRSHLKIEVPLEGVVKPQLPIKH